MKLNINNENKEIIKEMHELYERLQTLENGLQNNVRDQLLEFSSENYSIPHCNRWGENSCREVLEALEKQEEALWDTVRHFITNIVNYKPKNPLDMVVANILISWRSENNEYELEEFLKEDVYADLSYYDFGEV